MKSAKSCCKTYDWCQTCCVDWAIPEYTNTQKRRIPSPSSRVSRLYPMPVRLGGNMEFHIPNSLPSCFGPKFDTTNHGPRQLGPGSLIKSPRSSIMTRLLSLRIFPTPSLLSTLRCNEMKIQVFHADQKLVFQDFSIKVEIISECSVNQNGLEK